jgi:UDP-glucose 4-epimerase
VCCGATARPFLRLAQALKQAGVERFLFASSCSLYGAAGSQAAAEDAELFPVTPYGETKVMAERDPVPAGR